MANNETKCNIAKELSEVLHRYVRAGVITPAEAAEVADSTAWAVRETNQMFERAKVKNAKGESFVTSGVAPTSKDEAN